MPLRRSFVALALVCLLPGVLAAAGAGTAASGVGNATPEVKPTVNASRLAVFVDHTGQDKAGVAYVNALTAALRKSTRYRLTVTEDEADLVVVIVSVSPGEAGQLASALSVAYVANNEYRSLLASAARFAGRDVAAQLGRDSMGELDLVATAWSDSDLAR